MKRRLHVSAWKYNLELTDAGVKTIDAARLVWWREVYLRLRSAQLRRIGEPTHKRARTTHPMHTGMRALLLGERRT